MNIAVVIYWTKKRPAKNRADFDMVKKFFLTKVCYRLLIKTLKNRINLGIQNGHPMTPLTMSLLPFWALNMVVWLLSTQDQKALGFY